MALVLLLPILSLAAAAVQDRNDRCYVTETIGGVPVRVYQGDRACVDLTEPREMAGIWINEFEGSRFIEGIEVAEGLTRDGKAVWFSMDDETVRPVGFQPRLGHAYRLTIVGRSAVDMDRPPLEGYGHFGVSPGLVLADEIVAFEDLGPFTYR